MKNASVSLIIALALSITSSGLFAQNSEIKFTSVVNSVNQSSELEGTIEVSLQGALVPIMVNADTEIEESGDYVPISALSVGDNVRVDAFFADSGIVAEEITIVDREREQFRLRGEIEALTSSDFSAVLTIMGVDIVVNNTTVITRRGGGDGNSVAPSLLVVGDLVNVSGRYNDGIMLAERIHVGERQHGYVEVDGTVTALTDATMSVDIGDGLIVLVFIDADTAVRGNLVAGAYVEIEGQFNADLSILGFEIAMDDDGDFDADDDYARGLPGDDRGRNDVDDSGQTTSRIGREIRLRSDSTSLKGTAEYFYENKGSVSEQELEVEIDDARAGDVFTIVVLFGDARVEFGTLEADGRGEAEVEFDTDFDDPGELDLSPLLPAGKDVRDITAIEILLNGTSVLQGQF